jgi:hypothetical protein
MNLFFVILSEASIVESCSECKIRPFLGIK